MRTCWLALFTAVLCSVAAFGQPPDTMWTRAYGGINLDEAFGVCPVSDGGFLTVGRSRSYGADYSILAVRVDAMGDTMWMRSFGGSGFDHGAGAAEVAGNGFLIVGSTMSFGAGSYDAYVLRLTGAGDTLWTRTYGTAAVDFGYAILVTPDGGFVVAGSTNVAGQSLDMLLLKADANGNVQWQRHYGYANVDEAFSVEMTSDNGFLLGGRSVPPGGSRPDMFAVRTTSSGDTLWMRRFGDADWEECVGALETMDGGALIGGWTSNLSNSDFYMVRINAGGNQVWSHTYGGPLVDRASSLRRTSDGGAVLAGYTTSQGAGAADYYLLKFDTNNDTTWSCTYGGGGDDICYALALTTDGGYVAAGVSYSYGYGGGDFWLVRLPGFAGVAGFVRDSVTNDPLPNVWVSAIGQQNRARTDPMGYFVLTLAPDTTYDIITFGQCVARDTAFGIPVYLDSLTMHDIVLEIPEGAVPQTSVNIVAHNHTTAAETLMIYNNGLGILDYAVTVNTIPPAGDWLSVIPPAGSVPPGDSTGVAVQVHADTTDDGVYDLFGWLMVHMNSCPDSLVRVDVIATILDANDPAALPPASFALSAYPNPFNPATTLVFSLPREDRVQLVIYDVLGREVRYLLDARFAAGMHRITFDAADLPSGLYFARLQSSTETRMLKLMMMK